MFSKLKQIKDLRDQAKVMQNALGKENVTESKGGITMTMNGNMEITEIKVEGELSKQSLEQDFKSCANETIKKVQRLMAKKMQEMGGIPGLS